MTLFRLIAVSVQGGTEVGTPEGTRFIHLENLWSVTMNTQWQRYKELELLPDSVATPQTIDSPLIASLDRCWRSLLNRRARKLDHEYQVEYLERRLRLRCERSTLATNVWRKCWQVFNQPLSFGWQRTTHPEPHIQRTLDQTGQTWWKVYDPLTGHTAYLESESDVQIWLEERLYH